MGAYRIESLQTEHVIVSTTADKAGERVLIEPSTTPFDRTVVYINPPVEDAVAVATATIQGKADLFIAPESEKLGAHLIWSKEPFTWSFATNGPPGSRSIYPAGQDLYWFDKGSHSHLILESGKNAKEKEIYFQLVRIDRAT